MTTYWLDGETDSIFDTDVSSQSVEEDDAVKCPWCYDALILRYSEWCINELMMIQSGLDANNLLCKMQDWLILILSEMTRNQFTFIIEISKFLLRAQKCEIYREIYFWRHYLTLTSSQNDSRLYSNFSFDHGDLDHRPRPAPAVDRAAVRAPGQAI